MKLCFNVKYNCSHFKSFLLVKKSLVDTDILSAFLRGDQNVMAKFELHYDLYGCNYLSIITYYEILNGLLYKDAQKQLRKFQDFVALNVVLPLTIRSVDLSVGIQASLRKKGAEIGHTDTLIAGIALANGYKLVTNNTDHFKRIKGLAIENWLK